MSTVRPTHAEAIALARQFREASAALRRFRHAHEEDLGEAREAQFKLIEQSLRDAARDMTTAAVGIVIDEGKSSLAALAAVTDDATAVLDDIDGVKKALTVATALLGLAAAIPTGNPKEVIDAFKKLRDLVPDRAKMQQEKGDARAAPTHKLDA